MAIHTEPSPAEAADRLAIRELFDAYAHCADTRDAEGQKALFTPDTRFAVYLGGDGTHFNGQSTVTLDGDRATGLSYTIAHHLYTVDGVRMIMIASLRYRDTFAKIDGAWLFAERNLLLDWSETRPSPGADTAG
jgi:hypothetical protein